MSDLERVARVVSEVAAKEHELADKHRPDNPLNAALHLSICSALEDIAYRLRELI